MSFFLPSQCRVFSRTCIPRGIVFPSWNFSSSPFVSYVLTTSRNTCFINLPHELLDSTCHAARVWSNLPRVMVRGVTSLRDFVLPGCCEGCVARGMWMAMQCVQISQTESPVFRLLLTTHQFSQCFHTHMVTSHSPGCWNSSYNIYLPLELLDSTCLPSCICQSYLSPTRSCLVHVLLSYQSQGAVLYLLSLLPVLEIVAYPCPAMISPVCPTCHLSCLTWLVFCKVICFIELSFSPELEILA